MSLVLFAGACAGSNAKSGTPNPDDTTDTGGAGGGGSTGSAGKGGAAGGGSAGSTGTAGSGGGGAAGSGGGGAAGSGSTPDGGADGPKAAGGSDGGSTSTDVPTLAGNPFVYVGSGTVFQLNMATGALTPAGAGAMGGYMAADPKGKFMYTGNANVGAYGINATTGALTAINTSTVVGNEVTHLTVHPGGKWLFTASWSNGTASVRPITANGGVGAESQMLTPGMHSHQSVTDASGKFLFIPCPEANWIAQFKFDAATGMATPNTPPQAMMDVPRHLAFHPSGKFAYAAGEANSTIISMLYDATAGTLSAPMALPSVPAGTNVTNNTTAHIVVHPSGNFVFISNRGHNSIGTFAIDKTTGRLTPVDFSTAGGINVPRDFAVDPTGKYLIVVNGTTPGAIIVFEINPADGKLTLKGKMNSAQAIFVGILFPG